jgi:2,4-diaminopentanoate dehydrogenase
MTAQAPTRVIQWATGNVGRRALRAIVDHPDLELAGVWVHSPEKVGRDAGELCGLDPTGIRATGDAEALLALGADCVVYMPVTPDIDLLCRFLGGGLNVVTTAGFLSGRYLGDGVAARLDAAARAAGVGLFAAGINPGYVNNLCLTIAGACSRIHSLSCVEAADTTRHEAPLMWDILGYGKPPPPPGTMNPYAESMTNQFFDALDLMADGLRIELDGHQRDLEYAVATRDIDLGWMQFPEGTVAGQRTQWRGLVGDRTVITLGAIWKMTDDLDTHWPVEQEGYAIHIEGEPSIDVTWTMAKPTITGVSRERTYMGGALTATAMSVINAIPAVCAGPAGLRTYLDMPLISAAGSFFPTASEAVREPE